MYMFTTKIDLADYCCENIFKRKENLKTILYQ